MHWQAARHGAKPRVAPHQGHQGLRGAPALSLEPCSSAGHCSCQAAWDKSAPRRTGGGCRAHAHVRAEPAEPLAPCGARRAFVR